MMMTMSDEDSTSRDSGICEMEEFSPTCFSSLSSMNENEPMEIEDSRPLRPSKRSTLRREKTVCQVRLFDESPTSRSRFLRPSLSVRPINLTRKRSLQTNEWNVPCKLEKSSEHYHLESMMVDKDEAMINSIMRDTCGIQSTSSARISTSAFPRHHSTAAIMQRDEEMDEEDDSHLIVSYHLKTISAKCSTSYRRITAETLCNLMSTLSEAEFLENYVLIDCRYPFEYDGGHIKHAINFYDRDNVSKLFFDQNGKRRFKRIPIFYCEFSQKRGPSMAYALREDDRKRNLAIYPNCDYEEMYVLDKGFRNFHKYATQNDQTRFCSPNDYVEMIDFRYASELKKWNFHRRALVGQTVQRSESHDSSLTNKKDSENTTPAMTRVPSSRRHLFGDITNSPTNFGISHLKPEDVRSPSPSKLPLRQPQFT